MRKSLFGGYPHEGIKSQELFPNRVGTYLKEGKVHMIYDRAQYTFPDAVEQQKDWCMDRIHDYGNALNIAEQQILDMRAPYPFIPDDFGFTETDFIINPEGFSPTCYSKGKHMIANVEESSWMITGITNGSGITIDLPNAHIAFITLRALGVVTDKEFDEPELILVENAEGLEQYDNGGQPNTPILKEASQNAMAEMNRIEKEFSNQNLPEKIELEPIWKADLQEVPIDINAMDEASAKEALEALDPEIFKEFVDWKNGSTEEVRITDDSIKIDDNNLHP